MGKSRTPAISTHADVAMALGFFLSVYFWHVGDPLGVALCLGWPTCWALMEIKDVLVWFFQKASAPRTD